MKERHLIGFSLTSCVRDIVKGKVDIEEILFIQTGCSPRNFEDIEGILTQHEKVHWKGFGKQAREVVFNLLMDENGSRIGWASSWPEKACCNIGWGHWLSTKNAWKPQV